MNVWKRTLSESSDGCGGVVQAVASSSSDHSTVTGLITIPEASSPSLLAQIVGRDEGHGLLGCAGSQVFCFHLFLHYAHVMAFVPAQLRRRLTHYLSHQVQSLLPTDSPRAVILFPTLSCDRVRFQILIFHVFNFWGGSPRSVAD